MALSNGGAIQLLKKSMNYNNFLSWHRFASFISLFILIMGVVSPLQSFAKDESFQELLNQLSTKDFSEKFNIVEEIALINNSKTKLILNSLLEGKIYSIKNTKKVVFAIKDKNKYITTSLLNNEPLGTFSKSEVSKIKINNKIRKKIKTSLALLDLTHPEESIRLAAVKSTYKSISKEVFNTMQFLLKTEESEDVKNSMIVVISIYNLNSDNLSERLKAIESLEGNLEPVVKVQLKKLIDNDLDEGVRLKAQKAVEKIDSRIKMFKTVETIFFGLSFGSVLILAAIGLAITFGVMGVINMAHGELIMLGAYTTYVIQLIMPNHIGMSIFAAIPAAFIVSGIVGIAIERGIIRHLYGRPLETLLATFGVSLVLQQIVRTIFSPLNRSVATPEWMSGALEINGILSLTWNRLYIVVFCLIVFAGLIIVLKKTSLGLQVRAVSQDRSMACAMGVRSNWVDAMTFGLGSGVAGIAGVALSQLTNVGPNLGQAYIIDSFMVVVFGGVGNLWGTLISGFSLGVINKFMEPWAGAVLAKVLILIFIILFIQKRPRGLFPQKGRSAEVN
jgi:urea transport system permease protein|tara:strand:+ start:3056 stop:4738 length:1683 start_codon:yes stop_codon:yes gene_type:complete